MFNAVTRVLFSFLVAEILRPIRRAFFRSSKDTKASLAAANIIE